MNVLENRTYTKSGKYPRGKERCEQEDNKDILGTLSVLLYVSTICK